MHFQYYGLRNTWLDNCLKRPISEDLLVNGSKHCCNLNDSTFTIFIDHSERN